MSDTIWAGQVLRVDLTRRRIRTEPTADYGFALGGRGIGQWILFREVDPGVDALDPENIVTIGAGPLTGTMAPASARVTVDTKNALTGGVCASNGGGHFAPELKYAGFDAVVIEGRASSPVYLWIQDGQAEIRPADHLWGLDTWQTEAALRRELGEPRLRTALIGPAGENLVRGACLILDRARAAGRGGAGAVLGSKRLKGIAVRGTRDLSPAHGEAFVAEVERCLRKLTASHAVRTYRKGGTMLLAGAGGPDGTFPQGVRNDQDSYWPVSTSRRIAEPSIRGRYEVRRLGCFNCPIYCSHFYAVPDGPFAGTAGEGFEINSANAFGSNLDIADPAAILYMHTFCSRMGLDVDMAGTCLAFAFEAFERGHLTRSETGGHELRWGDAGAAAELLQAIVERRGIGDTLAEGVRRAAQTIGQGSEGYALHVKGADLNEPSMRLMKAWALGVVLSTHGGGHLDGSPHPTAWAGQEELARSLFDNPRPGAPGEYDGQAKAVIWHEAYKGLVDMLGICTYTSMWPDAGLLTADDYAGLLTAGTGRPFSGEELLRGGARLHQLQKAFNTLHTGHTRRDDRPPRRMLEPIRSGPHAGERLHPDRWEAMLDEYYAAQGWDGATGWQTEASLHGHGLDEAAEKLRRYGRLPPAGGEA